MGRKLLWFLLIDAILGPLMFAGLCSMRSTEPPAPRTNALHGVAARTPAPRTAAENAISGFDLSSASDPCAALRLARLYNLPQASQYDDIQKAAAALPGGATPNPRAVDCS